ncbi:MAG TPA: ABC transporter permease [Negativicutes bacterium]|nr:ABC transporter permease [Negativicutes bacterium]
MKKQIEIKKKKRPFWLSRLSLIIGMAVIIVVVVMALFPQLFTSIDPTAVDTKSRLAPPSDGHIFGTDNYGRDVFSRVVHGAGIDLMMGVVGTVIPFIIGGIFGMLAGYYGGILDSVLMRVVDVLMAFPFTILVIVIVTILGNGIINVYIALWIVGWIAYAKLVRSEVLVLKNSDYIQAAVIAGFTDRRILLRHMLPNVISSAVVYGVSDIVLCMLTGASMSFLGLGVQPPTPEWGAIMNEGKSYISYAWWITFFPGLVMAITGIGFSLLGDGLTDFLRRKGR